MLKDADEAQIHNKKANRKDTSWSLLSKQIKAKMQKKRGNFGTQAGERTNCLIWKYPLRGQRFVHTAIFYDNLHSSGKALH